MMRKGWLIRGGVAIAPSRQEALEHAWDIEQNTSLPRIEFAPDGVWIANNRADKTSGRGRDFGLVRTERTPRKVLSFDFLRYIRYWPTRNADEEKGRMAWQLDITRPVIVENLARFADHSANEEGQRTFSKYKWYANYFNEVAREIRAEKISIPNIPRVRALKWDELRKRSKDRRRAKKLRL